MGLQDHKILQENLTVQNLADAPNKESLTAQQLKAKFDEFPELLRKKLNALIDELTESYPDEDSLRLMQARVNAFAAHGELLGDTVQAGHVRMDGRTITLNGAGQMVAQGAQAQVASYEEALAGLDNSTMMTPLRVKQAIIQGRQGLNYAIGELCLLNDSFSAYAWHPRDGLLAAALADSGGESCRLVLYSFDGAQLWEVDSLTLPRAIQTLSWSEEGDALAYLDQQAQPGWAMLDATRLLAGQAPAGAALTLAWRPGQQLAIVWQDSPAMISLYQRQQLQLSEIGQLMPTQIEQIHGLAYGPHNGGLLALLASRQTDGCLLLLEQEGLSLTEKAATPLPTLPGRLAWHPGAEALALGLDGEGGFRLYGLPDSDGAWPLLFALEGSEISGFSWQAEGHYLVISQAGQGALYELYAYDGRGLQLLCESLWQGEQNQPSFHGNGRWLAVLSRVNQEQQIRVQSFSLNLSDRLLMQTEDFMAAPLGDYFIPEQVEQLTISCFAHPEPGQYFSFWGDYPARVSLATGNYGLCDGADEGGGARGRGLYQVIFLPEQGGYWRVLPLSLGLADSETALAATDDQQALTPWGGGLLLAKRGRRTATIVVAAQDSLHAQGADFTCSGQSDQLVLRQALAALPPCGGKLMLLEGTYQLDLAETPLRDGIYRLLETEHPHITICGAGKATKLRLADNVAGDADMSICLLYANAPGLTVHDISIDGAKDSGNNLANVSGLYLSLYAEQSEIRNCLIHHCSGPGLAGAAIHGHIHDNWFYENLSGICLSGGESIITANDIYHNSDFGIYADSAADVIMQNRISDNGKCGIELRNCNNAHVSQNLLMGNSSGLKVYGSSNIMMKDNFVRRSLGSLGYGADEKSIYVENSADLIVIGNWIRGKGAEAVSCSRLWASYGGTDWNVTV